MKQLTALPLIISALGLLLSNPSVAITSSQMQIRISAICNLHANISRVANPDVVYEMCINGARDSIQKSNSICEKKKSKFSTQANALHGMERAEYIEIAQAYSAGCDAGMPVSKTNNNIKQNSSTDEIKQREEIQKYRNEISNAFESRLVRVPNSTGKSCSINVWISQKGEVLSTKIKSGDNSACSFALSKTKDIKLSPMSDNLYKLFRNTTIDFNL